MKQVSSRWRISRLITYTSRLMDYLKDASVECPVILCFGEGASQLQVGSARRTMSSQLSPA
jgi:hypothetical protein